MLILSQCLELLLVSRGFKGCLLAVRALLLLLFGLYRIEVAFITCVYPRGWSRGACIPFANMLAWLLVCSWASAVYDSTGAPSSCRCIVCLLDRVARLRLFLVVVFRICFSFLMMRLGDPEFTP